MRIITGKYKGRKLKSFADNDIRPLMDRTKKFIFDVLQRDIKDATVCDLFAGTGSFGIEAISQGAKDVTFVDMSPKAVKSIEHNIKSNNISEPYLLLRQDVNRFIKRNTRQYDIIFCDAPYQFKDYAECVAFILKSDMLTDNGLLIVEHFGKTDMPEETADFIRIREKKFGKTTITFYGRRG
ncbi:MAG: 16S rRNA (guanine(966)-N(2))-methyltransferase RsmD [Calditrichaeota bacterium]|nr:16S rRNA (guanine(966)-N(2))-methyltransferase RsmD [Calditrichota bacterium]